MLRQFRQFGANFFERQPDPLREHDERHASNHGARIPPVAGVVAFGVNQTLFFIETQGRGRRAAAFRHLADCQHAVHTGSLSKFPLDFKCT